LRKKKKESKMNFTQEIIDYENGDMDFDRMVDLFQRMINDGIVWKLQGSYGRTANILVQDGYCILPNGPKEG